jgi:hypothetical protein
MTKRYWWDLYEEIYNECQEEFPEAAREFYYLRCDQYNYARKLKARSRGARKWWNK